MVIELKRSIQLCEKKNQAFFQSPSIYQKDENPYNFLSSNAQKSTSEKESESDPRFAYHNKGNVSIGNNQVFNVFSNDASRSNFYSGILNSKRDSNTGSEIDQQRVNELYNGILDLSQQEFFDHSLKNTRNTSLINNLEQKKNSSQQNNINNGNNGYNNGHLRQNTRTQSLENKKQKQVSINEGGGGVNGGGKYENKQQGKQDMMIIADVVNEDDIIFTIPYNQETNKNEQLFNAPPFLSSQPTIGNIINFSRNSTLMSSFHNRNYSGSESQSLKQYNDVNIKSKHTINSGRTYLSGFETDEIESSEKSIDDKINKNTQKSSQHQKRIKQLNLSELKTINEQQSYALTEERSLNDSWNTKYSNSEQRKTVSNYLFNEREPMYVNKYSKCYIASKNQKLVLVKMMERKKIQQFNQEKMRQQYKQLIKKINTKFDNIEENQSNQISILRPSSTNSDLKQIKQIVNILDYFQTKAFIYIVYEYLHEKSLLSILQQQARQKLDEQKALSIIEQILNALEELYQQINMFQAHGNLKLENIFWDGNNVKLADFCPTYLKAKIDINNFDKIKQQKQNSDTKQLGIIYLQLICGVNSINFTTNQNELQNYLKSENIPKYISDIILSSIFSETASLSDFRRYINKYQSRIRKSNQMPTSISTSNRSSIVYNTPPMKSSFNRQSSPNRMNTNYPIIRGSDDRQFMMGSQLEKDFHQNAQFDNDADQGKTKETFFFKKYSYTQSSNLFELRINHLKVTKHKIGDDFISNEQEFETNYTIPIFKNTPEEYNLRKKKNQTQLNYNPKYQWVFLNELDNLPYYEREQKSFEETNSNQYLIDGYYKLLNHRYQLMKCRDKKSKKNYIVKCISIEDDQEFNQIIREIAILKYIEHNIQPGLKVEKINEEGDHFQQTKVCLSNSLSLDKTKQLSAETKNMAMAYLQNLYREADKEVTKKFQGGIQKFVDSYAVQRIGNELTFFLIFEEVKFSLKDFILKNSIDLEDNPDREEINQLQLFNMIKVITKQIKALKRIGIVHNNITPENILFQNCVSGKKRIILSNFSQALILRHDQSQDEFQATFQKLPNESFKYKSPEIRKMMEVSMQEKETVSFDPIKSEIFSLGLCAIELKFNKIIKDSQIVAIIETVQQDTIDGDLMLYMIHFSASIRFSEKEVLQYLKEETILDKQTLSLISSPLVLGKNNFNFQNFQHFSLNQNYTRSKQKSFTQVLSVQNFHRIQENNMFTNYNNQKNSITSLSRLPSLKALQSEQPQFKLLTGKSAIGVNKRDLFQYTEISLSNFGDVSDGLQVLYHCKCTRMIYMFNRAQIFLEELELRFFKNKQKFQDQSKLEYLVLQEMAMYRRDIYDYSGSADYSKRVLGIQQKYFLDDTQTAGKLQLNIVLLDQEKNSGQIIYFLRSALENYKDSLGGSSPKLVKILTLLGDEFAQKGQVTDALHQYQECMIITNYLGYQGPFGLKLLDKLGWAFFQTSDYQSSLKFFLKSTQIKEKVLMQKDSSLAEAYNNLAECFRVLNDQIKAIFYYEQSLNVILQLQIENQKNPVASQGQFLLQLKAQVYNNLGIMYKQISKYEKAIKLFNEAYSIKCQIYGPNSLEVQECLYNVAVIYDDQDQHTQAMQIYDQIIQQFKVSKDLDSLVYADCLHNKGICYYNINDFTKSLNLLNEALSIKRKKVSNSVSLAVTLQNIALVYHKIGQYKKSLQIYEEALKIFVKKLKPDHPYIYIIQENMKQTQRFSK